MTRPSPGQPRTPRKKGHLPDEEVSALDQLPGLLSRYSDGTFLKGKLNRIPDKPPRRPAYLDTIEPITAELVDDVKEQYGGGTYRVYVHAGPKYVDTLNFSIEGKPKQVDDATTTPAPAARQRDAVELAKDITLIATPILGALGAFITSLRSTTPASTQDPVQLLTLMQASEERGREQGRRLGRLEGAGGLDKDESVIGFAKQVVPPFLSMLGDNMKARRERNGTTPAVVQDNAPPPATAVVVHDAPPPPPPPMPPGLMPGYEWLSDLRPYYRQLAQQAEADNDPDIIADFLWSQLDDAQQDAVSLAVGRDDFYPTIRAELAPVHARHPDWLTQFLARLVETAKVQADDDNAPAPAPPKAKARAKK